MRGHLLICLCRSVLSRVVVPGVVLLLVSSGIVAGETAPTAQDMQLMARVISFQNRPVSGRLTLGIVFDPADALSQHVAQKVAALMQNGVLVGDIRLGGVMVAQNALAGTHGLDAIFATPRVDAVLLRAVLARLHVPCLSVDQAGLGATGCMVAVRSDPSVSIVLDEKNADAAGVHFATAFRMMVQEQ